LKSGDGGQMSPAVDLVEESSCGATAALYVLQRFHIYPDIIASMYGCSKVA